MAKPLGPKSKLIREAILAKPGLGNIEIAESLKGSAGPKGDKIEVTAQDVASQKQQMKKAGVNVPAAGKRGPKKGSGAGVAVQTPVVPQVVTPPPAVQASPVDLIDGLLTLADECGGIEQLKRLVDRLAQR